MRKNIVLCLLCVVFLFSMVGCGASTKISDFSGTWKQVNSKSEDSYQEAIMSGDSIEIYWISDSGENRSLYWAGTYIAPETEVDTYSWDSVNDHEKTENALLASTAETKTISYKNGQLYYEVSALGTTTTVKLEKTK